MLLAFMVAYAGVALMSGAGGMGVAGGAGQASGVSALQAGAGAAIANLAGATIFGDGQLTSIQNGYLGAIKSGKMSPPNADGHSQRTALGIYNRWILPAIDKGQAHDSIGTWFGIKCPLNLTVAQCQAQGYNPGMGWRTDSFGIEQTVKRMAENWKRCKAGGYTGELLNKCAAPGGSNLLLNIRK